MKKRSYIFALLLVIAAAVVTAFLFFNTNDTKTLSGTVTTKFTDCEGGREMNREGQITTIDPVTCDGGSYITIDHENDFGTASGLTSVDESYSVDVTNIKVGDEVKVTYNTNQKGYHVTYKANQKSQIYHALNCDGCRVEKIE